MLPKQICRCIALAVVAIFLLCNVPDSQAGELYIVTRANHITPHTACVLRYDDGAVRWLHFRPAFSTSKKSLALYTVEGVLDRQPFAQDINHLVGFEVADEKLQLIEREVDQQFATGSMYTLSHRDCVSLVIFACRIAGLKTKPDHFAPINLFNYVSKQNKYTTRITNYDWGDDSEPLPWRKRPAPLLVMK